MQTNAVRCQFIACSVNLKIYDILLVTRVFRIINTKERIEWRRMKTREIDENLFPTEISSFLKIDHRTLMGLLNV